jgi:hypothetical protein
MDLHKQHQDDPEKAAELDAAIPWDGQVNGRCVEFEERGIDD